MLKRKNDKKLSSLDSTPRDSPTKLGIEMDADSIKIIVKKKEKVSYDQSC